MYKYEFLVASKGVLANQMTATKMGSGMGRRFNQTDRPSLEFLLDWVGKERFLFPLVIKLIEKQSQSC